MHAKENSRDETCADNWLGDYTEIFNMDDILIVKHFAISPK